MYVIKPSKTYIFSNSKIRSVKCEEVKMNVIQGETDTP